MDWSKIEFDKCCIPAWIEGYHFSLGDDNLR